MHALRTASRPLGISQKGDSIRVHHASYRLRGAHYKGLHAAYSLLYRKFLYVLLYDQFFTSAGPQFVLMLRVLRPAMCKPYAQIHTTWVMAHTAQHTCDGSCWRPAPAHTPTCHDDVAIC